MRPLLLRYNGMPGGYKKATALHRSQLVLDYHFTYMQSLKRGIIKSNALFIGFFVISTSQIRVLKRAFRGRFW